MRTREFFADARFCRLSFFDNNDFVLLLFCLFRLGGRWIRCPLQAKLKRAIEYGNSGQHNITVVKHPRLIFRFECTLKGRPGGPDRIVAAPEPCLICDPGQVVIVIAEIFKKVNPVPGLDEGDRFFQIQTGGIGRAGRKKQQCAEQTAGQQGACG